MLCFALSPFSIASAMQSAITRICRLLHAARGDGGRADTYSRRFGRRQRVERNGVLVDGYIAIVKQRFQLLARDARKL